MCLWEGYDTNNVGGVFLFQPRLLHRGLVQGLEKELCQLMETIAADPLSPLSHLASQISPPFSSAMRTRTRRLY